MKTIGTVMGDTFPNQNKDLGPFGYDISYSPTALLFRYPKP